MRRHLASSFLFAALLCAPLSLLTAAANLEHGVAASARTTVLTMVLPRGKAPAEPKSDWLDKIKEVVETGAILVGGWWTWLLFVKKRQQYPRAAITHSVDVRKLDDEYSLVHVTVTVKNPGEVLLSLVSHLTRLQVVVPPVAALLKTLQDGKNPVGTGQTEYPWPMIGQYGTDWSDEANVREVEPGESQDVDVDFFVPNSVQTVLVYSYFKNKKKKNREIGWDCTTLHDTTQPSAGGSATPSGAIGGGTMMQAPPKPDVPKAIT